MNQSSHKLTEAINNPVFYALLDGGSEAWKLRPQLDHRPADLRLDIAISDTVQEVTDPWGVLIGFVADKTVRYSELGRVIAKRYDLPEGCWIDAPNSKKRK